MATIIEPVLIDPEAPVKRPRAVPIPRDRFFLWVTILCALIAFGGFAGTYWLQLPARTFRGPALLHVHGALCTAWVLFLISQSNLVTGGRVRSHRDWGLFGIALASVLTVVAVTVAISSMNARVAAGQAFAGQTFLIVPLSAILLFAGFTAAAIANVRRPDWHKRFMIVGTLGLLEAAVARVFFLIGTGGGPGMRPAMFPPPPVAQTAIAGFLLELVIVAGMIRDWRLRGRVHRAWIIGLVVMTVVVVVRAPISETAAWRDIAASLGHIAG
jgi:hypothetical protein